MSKICYLCAHAFNNSTVLQHEEHIIQNAIGGALISQEILCKECGGKLGKTIDRKFADALSSITSLLRPPRDRGNYSQARDVFFTSKEQEARGLEQIPATLKSDFSVVPKQPVYFKNESKKTLTIVAAKEKQAKQYSQYAVVKAELANGYRLEIKNNILDYVESVVIKIHPNSIEILRGVLKIAIGYASHNNVARECFSHLVTNNDLINSEKALRKYVFQYYPVDDAERLFETQKYTHEDSYPTHHLYLFSQGKNLYCYVELFGSIQKYVHLSESYHGAPITEKFVQKAEKWEFNERVFTAKDPKDLLILASEFSVPLNERSFEEIQSEVLHRARCRAYSLDPDCTVKKVRGLVLLLANFSLIENGEQFKIVQSLLEKANNAKTHLDLELLDKLKTNPIIAINLINRTFNDFRMGSIEFSHPEKAQQIPQADLDKYTYYKLYELLCSKGKELIFKYHVIN